MCKPVCLVRHSSIELKTSPEFVYHVVYGKLQEQSIKYISRPAHVYNNHF